MAANSSQVHETLGSEPFVSMRGQPLHIRRLAPSDAPKLKAFVEKLSPHSRHVRFFSPMAVASASTLRYLVDVDFRDRAAFVATRDQSGELTAVARYEVLSPGVAEFAIAIADDWHGQGIGPELLGHLAQLAQANGIAEFTTFVLFENRRMFDVLRASGLCVSSEPSGGGSQVRLTLAGACPPESPRGEPE